MSGQERKIGVAAMPVLHFTGNAFSLFTALNPGFDFLAVWCRLVPVQFHGVLNQVFRL